MPLYDYECKDCGHGHSETLPMAENMTPTESPCEECEGGPVIMVFVKMNVGDSVRLGVTKPSGDFKEVMEKIHENTVGSNLDQKMSQSIKRKTSL